MNRILTPQFSVRLVIGAALDAAMLIMLPRLAMWSSVEREWRFALAYGGLASAAVVCVLPVLRRGTDLQRVGAVVILMVSGLALWPAVDFCFNN